MILHVIGTGYDLMADVAGVRLVNFLFMGFTVRFYCSFVAKLFVANFAFERHFIRVDFHVDP